MMMVECFQVGMGRRPQLSVFGSDWDTEDGTGDKFCILVFPIIVVSVFVPEFVFGTPWMELVIFGLRILTHFGICIWDLGIFIDM